MRIEAIIDYWEENVLSFDPEKILIRLRNFFPQVETDWIDQSRYRLERFFQTVKEKDLEPPLIIVEKKWEVFSRNTPTFKFKLLTEPNIEITGLCNRWRIEFESQQKIEAETEKTIIEFLKSIRYGEIRSNIQTDFFCKIDEDNKNYWILEESL